MARLQYLSPGKVLKTKSELPQMPLHGQKPSNGISLSPFHPAQWGILIPELLSQYLELRSGQRADWTSRGKLKGTVADFNKVQAAMDFLRKKGISTVESLDTRLDEISQTAVSVMESVKKSEKRIKAIDTMLSYIDKYEANKPVHKEYAAIGWKKKKEQFAESHREELDTYNAAVRYFKANLKGNTYSRKNLERSPEPRL